MIVKVQTPKSELQGQAGGKSILLRYGGQGGTVEDGKSKPERCSGPDYGTDAISWRVRQTAAFMPRDAGWSVSASDLYAAIAGNRALLRDESRAAMAGQLHRYG